MKNKSEIYLNLDNLTEEQQKNVKELINYYPTLEDCVMLFYDDEGGYWNATTKYHEPKDNPYLKDKSEISYSEFTELLGKTEQLEEKTFAIREYSSGDFGDLGREIGMIQAVSVENAREKFQKENSIKDSEIGFYNFSEVRNAISEQSKKTEPKSKTMPHKNIDTIDFKGEKIVVHCPTPELAHKVLKKAESEGFTWRNGDSLVNNPNWERHGEEMCYNFLKQGSFYSDKSYYNSNGYQIISAEEYLGEKEEAPDWWDLIDLEKYDKDMIEGAKKLLEENGYFVLPKAKEGNFVDLTDFEGERMYVKYGGCESEEYVFIKYKNKYATIDCIGDTRFWNVEVRPIKQSMTYQELVEKIGLERACELAGVEISKTEIK